MFNDKVILITGGTGSFGKACTQALLTQYKPRKVIVFSRDEFKQFEMAKRFPTDKHANLRYFLGDVRDKDRLHRAFNGVDYVIHAAAIKQVPAAEYNPIEAVRTNIMGAANVIEAATDQGVKRVVALSTDKAVSPVNLYGATKLCSDKLMVAGNVYSSETRFSVVRYGNVMGSRGSVIPLFLSRRETGVLPVTDPDMTRFWITLEQSVAFVLKAFERMGGGEIFVPKLPSTRIGDLVKAIAPECKVQILGVRPGEKIHESLIMTDENRNTLEYDDCYMVFSPFSARRTPDAVAPGVPVSLDFEYCSRTNPWVLSVEELREAIANLDPEGL